MKSRTPHFINWGQNIQCRPTAYFQPETEEEIQSLVQQYSKIRMVGSGHSWSPLCETDGVNISLDSFQNILHVDRLRGLVTAQAGIKMWQLNKSLHSMGLALENQGSIDQQSIAGAVSTGTHGSGIRFPILADQLHEIKMIKADGSTLVIHREKDRELFQAVGVNLGCLGIITEVTLRVKPAFNLRDLTTTKDFSTTIEEIEQYITQNDFFKIWWLPPTREAVVYRYQQTQEKTNDSRLRRYLKDEVFSVAAYRTLVTGAKIFPSLAHPVNRFLTSQMKGPLDRIEESSKVFIVPEPPKHLETEWAFDAKEAKEILKAYKELLENRKYHMNFIQEIRFTQGDNFWLSGCHGRDTMWIGLYCFKHENFYDKLKDFEVFAKQFKGRPHWGKLFTHDTEYLRQQYPKWDDFNALRKKLDPTGKFSNNFIERIFD